MNASRQFLVQRQLGHLGRRAKARWFIRRGDNSSWRGDNSSWRGDNSSWRGDNSSWRGDNSSKQKLVKIRKKPRFAPSDNYYLTWRWLCYARVGAEDFVSRFRQGRNLYHHQLSFLICRWLSLSVFRKSENCRFLLVVAQRNFNLRQTKLASKQF